MTKTPMLDTAAKVIAALKKRATPEKLAGMVRVGINTDCAVGVSLPDLRKLAKETVQSRELAEELWATEIHEARILAGMICPVGEVDEALAERWVAQFDSWDICDQVMDLFAASDIGWQLAVRWCDRPEEFVRRTGFGMFCWFAVYDKTASNTKFVRTCFPKIRKHADDERNFVKKAVNWALRNIGKRNLVLNEKAIALAEKLLADDNKTTRWIGKDALRELTSEKIQKRLRKTQ